MTTQYNLCPECGTKLAPDMVLCGNCMAFAHDVNPWQRDQKLVAFPIAIAVTALIGLLLRGPMETSLLAKILSDDISLTILGLGIYAMIQIAMKNVVTRRQSAAFRVIRRLLAPGQPLHRDLAENARIQLTGNGLGPYNALLAYNRLQWILEAAEADPSEKTLVLQGMRDHNDTDWDSLENSFAHVQFMVWLLPSLGFLGTVWGMTGALGEFSGAINGDVGDLTFKNSLTETTQRLGVAFHTTLVGLAMVIPVLLAATAARRRAQHLLELLDRFFIRLSCKPLAFQPPTEEAVEVDVELDVEDLIAALDSEVPAISELPAVDVPTIADEEQEEAITPTPDEEETSPEDLPETRDATQA